MASLHLLEMGLQRHRGVVRRLGCVFIHWSQSLPRCEDSVCFHLPETYHANLASGVVPAQYFEHIQPLPVLQPITVLVRADAAASDLVDTASTSACWILA